LVSGFIIEANGLQNGEIITWKCDLSSIRFEKFVKRQDYTALF